MVASGMETEVVSVDRRAESQGAARRAQEVLLGGGLVAFPTETVYGLAATVTSPSAIERLRSLKSRPGVRPFTVHIGSPEAAARFAPELPALACRMIRKGWPGPLTLVLSVNQPASAPVMQDLNGAALGAIYHNDTVGLRCPDDSVAKEFLDAVETPVVAASANLAGHPPPASGADVLRELAGRVDLLLDAGPTKYAKASTIVRVCGSTYELVREGVYDARIIKAFSTVRLLLVCTGNTCRSPMAAALTRQLLAERMTLEVSALEEHGIVVASAGTAGGRGDASPHAVTVMGQRGLDLAGHQSSALTPELIHQADHIFVMTRSHRDVVLDMVPSATRRVELLLEGRDVQDPIGGTEADYEECARILQEGLKARLREVIV